MEMLKICVYGYNCGHHVHVFLFKFKKVSPLLCTLVNIRFSVAMYHLSSAKRQP